jgi:APA family basic amino acid/polyamine antiporter
MHKALGFWRCWALVVGIMIGSGIFMLPAVLAPYGGLSLLGWLAAGGGTLLIVLMLGSLARRQPGLGGPYAYTRAAYGDLAGFLVGWGYWVSIWAGVAAIAVAFVGYAGVLFPLLSASPAAGGMAALAVIWVVTGVNVWGVREAGALQLVTTLLKLLPLFLIAGGGLLLGDVTEIPERNPESQPVIVLAAGLVLLIMWAFVGVEGVTIPADDIEEPERNIPRALVVGTLTVTAVYLLATYGVMALVPLDELAQSTSPFADAAGMLFGPIGAVLVAVGAMVSTLGSMNGNVLVGGMMARALAKDGLFPGRFAGLGSGGSPAFALVASGLLSSLLVVMNYSRGLVAAFELLILLSTLTTLLPYAASAAAELKFIRRDRLSGASIPLGTVVIAGGALLFSLFTIIGSGVEVLVYGAILLAAGLPVFWSQKRREVPVAS